MTRRGRRTAAPLAAALAAWTAATLAGCASPGRAARPPAPRAAAPAPVAPAAAPAPPSEPSPPVPPPAPPARSLPEPDRTRPPWSQTRVAPIAVGAVERGRAERGAHLRVGTARGTVHVWRPRAYRHRGAGTVVYLHGYYTDVDQAWVDHRLAQQFRASGRNALFLAVEAPSWNGEEPSWPGLDELFATLEEVAKVRIPRGPIVVAGHSGGYRGIVPWLADPRIAEVLLLDGFYQNERGWSAWLDGAPKGERRLVLVGLETAARSEAWLPSRPGAVLLPRVPARARGLRKAERRTPVLYLRSQHDHMAIIEEGEVLPLLLRYGRLRPHGVRTP